MIMITIMIMITTEIATAIVGLIILVWHQGFDVVIKSSKLHIIVNNF